jgi:hypothetical protein
VAVDIVFDFRLNGALKQPLRPLPKKRRQFVFKAQARIKWNHLSNTAMLCHGVPFPNILYVFIAGTEYAAFNSSSTKYGHTSLKEARVAQFQLLKDSQASNWGAALLR